MSALNDRNRQHLVGKVADALRARIAAQPSVAGPRARQQQGGLGLRKRLMIVAGVLALGSAALVVRAFDVQVVNNDFYLQQGQARSLREIPIPTSRGMITDRNGEPLAVSTPVESVWGNPKELLENPARIPELAKALEVPADVLTRKLTQRSNKEFLYLKRRISPEQARRILAHNIPGVFSQREFRRFYPQGEAMAHVLGFTNVDDRGQEGLELSFDHSLSGKPGSKRVIRDGQGRIVESVDLIEPAVPGHDLTLTIDRRIQFLAYRELRNQLVKTGASSGSAVIMDIATGEVLAMVNLPSYNPNAAAMGNIEAHRNRAVTDVFEPGSTMKPITVAAALNARIVTPDTRIDLNPGWMALDRKYTVRDHNNYGVQTVTGIITKSSNIGAAKLAARMKDQYFYDFIRQFGYGQKPGSGFPGESAGVLAPPARWYGTTKATMAYGYGMSATPLQIAMVYAALGNGGKLITPTFVKGERHEPKQVLDPQIAHEVMRMMQTVTETGGTATQAAILGYHVAGKTGTARKFSESGGYTRRYLSYFAGVVPVQNPRFSMVVVINDPDPERGYFGGLVSAPVFRNVMDGALRLMDVPPDDIDTWLAAQNSAQHASELRGEEGRVLPDASASPLAEATLPDPVDIPVTGGAR
jgi:cell division protein FtsI (penicillin-binding protein 3)